MAQTYFTSKNCNIVVVGNEEVLEKLKLFDADGKIEFLDAFGEPIKETKKADISKEVLIDNYILAVTKTTSQKAATKKLKKIKSVEKTSELSTAMIPFPLNSTELWVAPNCEGQKLEGQGMLLNKSYFDGKSGGSSAEMQKVSKALTAEEIAAKNKSQGLFPEMNYAKTGMSFELIGIETLDKNEAYVVKTFDGKTETIDYFDTKSFMKVRSTSIRVQGQESEETETIFSDFKEVHGIIFPHMISTRMSDVELSGIVKQIKINGNGNLSTFK
jgi:hypothetical protein